MGSVSGEIRKLKEADISKSKRLDSLEKSVNNLKRAVSHLERSPDTKTGVRVPRTPLPDTLDDLEIGSQPKGT